MTDSLKHPAEANLASSPDPDEVLSLKWLGALAAAGLIFEWLLFELQRTPYRPPVDMSTFLGAPELLFVRSLMWIVGIPEGILILCLFLKLSSGRTRPASALGRAIPIASALIGGLLLTGLVAHLFYENVELEMRLEDADDETHYFDCILSDVEAADVTKGVAYLANVSAYHKRRFERLEGSSLDRIVERARLSSINQVIGILRRKTGKDFGDDPGQWVNGLRNAGQEAPAGHQ
jgi:hypothetical protein